MDVDRGDICFVKLVKPQGCLNLLEAGTVIAFEMC